MAVSEELLRAKYIGVLKIAADEVADSIRSAIPARKGPQPGPLYRATNVHTKDTISVDVAGPIIRIKGAEHLRPLMEGAAPHFIFPKAKKVLAFPIANFKLRSAGGRRTRTPRAGSRIRTDIATKKFIFATHVIHPGIKANPFINRAVSKAPLVLRRLLRGL